MSLLRNLSIKVRLILLVAVSATVMVVIGVSGLNGMRTLSDDLESIYADRLVPTGQIGTIMNLMRENRTQVLLSLQHDPENAFSGMHDHPLSLHTDQIEANIKRITVVWDEYMKTTLTREEQLLAEEYAAKRAVFVNEGLRAAVAALTRGDFSGANRILLLQVNPLFTAANEPAEKLLQLQLDVARAAYEGAQRDYANFRNITIALLLIGLGLGIFMSFCTVRSIAAAVADVETTADRMAAGDLTARADQSGNDELSHIAHSFNKMGERFRAMMQQLATASSQVAAAAEETSAVTTQTTNGIKRQQAETDQVATAMNEMNATVHEVASNASLAATAAHTADEESAAGTRVVSQTIDAIESLAGEVEKAAGVIGNLDRESDKIGSVLDVIRGIAEQTNLLALNAAIEAARAGEQGRGFAVVADEVRTLASRTQQSTSEIQAMIEQLQGGAKNAVKVMEVSRNQARAGVEQVSQAGTSLESITRAVATINDMNTQIASAAEEQSAVAEEINRNIVNISQVADESTQGAQQTAAASEELARLAEQMQSLVSQFKT